MSGAGFELANTELRLGLPGDGACEAERKEKKRVFLEINDDQNDSYQKAPQSKNQLTGWPPVCSYRRRNSIDYEKDGVDVSKSYVKTSMDGVPFLRKLDVWKYEGYLELVAALEKLFGIGGALKDVDNSEYVPIYEDNDGDWMLVGDVPWNMFVESCKRLRVMKKSEAKGFVF